MVAPLPNEELARIYGQRGRAELSQRAGSPDSGTALGAGPAIARSADATIPSTVDTVELTAPVREIRSPSSLARPESRVKTIFVIQQAD